MSKRKNEAQNSYEMPNVYGFGQSGGYVPSSTDGVVKTGEAPPSGAGPVLSTEAIAKWHASPDSPVSWAPRGGKKE